MKTKSKLLAVFLSALMLASAFAGCGKEIEDETATTPTTTSATTTVPEITSAPEIKTTTSETTSATTVTTTETVSETTTATSESFTVEGITPKTMYASLSVNVRKGPSVDYDRIGGLNTGEAVTVNGQASTGWYRVVFNGATGYISDKYLTDTKPAVTTTSGEDNITVEDDDEDISIDPGNSDNDDNQIISGNYGDYEVSTAYAEENGLTYIRSLLDSEKRRAYDEVMSAIRACSSIAYVTGYVGEEETYDFMDFIFNSCIEYSHVVNSYTPTYSGGKLISVKLSYRNTASQEAERVSALRSYANKAIDATAGMSDYQKAKYLHDYLILGTQYDADGVSPSSTYGAIVDKRATCFGYGKAMFYLLSKSGLDTVFVTGIGDQAKHYWVKVKLDGTWYNVDPTWDDPTGRSDPKYISYDYFLITDSEISNGHARVYDQPFFSMPSATSTSYNWHRVNDRYATSYDEAISLLKSGAVTSARNGSAYVYLKCSSASVYSQVKEELNASASPLMQEILKYARNQSGAGVKTNTWSKPVCHDDLNTITLVMRFE